MKTIKVKEQDKGDMLIRDAAADLYAALRMLLNSTNNREGIVAIEAAKRALEKADGKILN